MIQIKQANSVLTLVLSAATDHVVEERWTLDVGRLVIPRVQQGLGGLQGVPARVALL